MHYHIDVLLIIFLKTVHWFQYVKGLFFAANILPFPYHSLIVASLSLEAYLSPCSILSQSFQSKFPWTEQLILVLIA
jgi:hypothetical protein